MRRFLFGMAASVLAVVGLAGAPSPARAEHHDWDHHGRHHNYYGNRGWYGGPRYYAPYYAPRFYVQPYGYDYYYPSYGPYSGYAYPRYGGFSYQGPYFSLSIGPW